MVSCRMSAALAAALLLSLPAVATAETLIQKLLRIAGLTAAPAQMRGPADEIEPGNIWMASAESGASKALTTDGGYTSPIFSPDGRVYALKGGSLVRLPQETGAGVAMHKVPAAVKLVGFDGTNADDLVVLLNAPHAGSPLGVLSLKSGRVTALPYDATSEEQRRMLAQIRGQERKYGTTVVYTKTERRRGPSRSLHWSDVYIRRGTAAPLNISKSDGVSCVQPALSPDGRSVAFIKVDGRVSMRAYAQSNVDQSDINGL
jgi:WD40 repeat protein